MAPDKKASKPPPYVRVELIELARGVTGAEVVSPAAQDRIQVRDQHPDILYSIAVRPGQFLHPLVYPLHASSRRPPLQVVATHAALQQPSRDSGMEVATKEVEAFPALSEVYDSRLLRVQLQSQFVEDFPHQFQGRLGLLPASAQDHTIVGVPHQPSVASLRPGLVQDVQIDVGEQ